MRQLRLDVMERTWSTLTDVSVKGIIGSWARDTHFAGGKVSQCQKRHPAKRNPSEQDRSRWRTSILHQDTQAPDSFWDRAHPLEPVGKPPQYSRCVVETGVPGGQDTKDEGSIDDAGQARIVANGQNCGIIREGRLRVACNWLDGVVDGGGHRGRAKGDRQLGFHPGYSEGQTKCTKDVGNGDYPVEILWWSHECRLRFSFIRSQSDASHTHVPLHYGWQSKARVPFVVSTVAGRPCLA